MGVGSDVCGRRLRFYPSYYDETRPVPSGIPASISYGGKNFDISLPASSVNGADLTTIKVALIRTGYSTHAMSATTVGALMPFAETFYQLRNMGMRYVQLNNTFTGATNGSAVLHVSQLPPNPSLLVPGPALLSV